MSVAFKRPRSDGRCSHSYYCAGDYVFGGAQCGHVAGRALDAAVVTDVLCRLLPPSRDVIEEAWEAARKKELQGRHHRRTLLNRARQRAVDLEARFLSVSPANRLVAEDLEGKLEAAKREVERLENSATTEPEAPALFTKTAFGEVVRCCSDCRASSMARPQVTRTVSFCQLGRLAGAPGGYLASLPAELAARNLNHGLEQRAERDKPLQCLFRVNGAVELRCATLDSYTRIWNHDVKSGCVNCRKPVGGCLQRGRRGR
jgi:hypothetical protein